MGDLSKHFSKAEFQCRCGCGFGLKDGDINPLLIERLELIRAHFGTPIHINSGCRCARHNKAVGGAEHSQHLLGNAADIICRDVSPLIVYNYINDTFPTGGTGLYRLFTHTDVRKDKRFWHGR